MRTALPALLLLFAGCDRSGAGRRASEPEAAVPRAPTLHRLTDAQWRNAVADLTGQRFSGELPPDYVVYSYAAVGAAELTVPPYDFELYEDASWTVADAALPDAAAIEAFFGCDPDVTLLDEGAADPVEHCLAPALTDLASRAWRRPLEEGELDNLLGVYDRVQSQLGNPVLAARASLATVLLSPSFLFRVEAGVPVDGDPRRRAYTDHELASRLSFLLTDGPPDQALLDDADAGLLRDPERLRRHAERLLRRDRSREALTRFFAQWMDLDRLDLVDKDPDLYPWFTDAVRVSARVEVERLFQELALGPSGDLGALLTTDLAYVDAELAPIYGVSLEGSEPELVHLDPAQQRGGVLGRVAPLALNAHANQNSPTRRGKFVRSRMLCQDIPPPPEGVIASLDEITASGTLRQRLEVHATDPTCASCHDLMDPLGYAFENFDPVGHHRTLDAGLPVDASGSLDGVSFVGAEDLAQVLVTHDRYPYCVAAQVWRQATGSIEESHDGDTLEALGQRFTDSGDSLEALLLAMVQEEAFLTGRLPDEQASAGPIAYEACNGLDEDQDRAIDEGIVRACDTPTGLGLQRCVVGAWGDCEAPPAPAEDCDGLDDDGDGAVDEGLEVDRVVRTAAELAAAHGSCDIGGDADSPACNAAIHRDCRAMGCAETGFGPVAVGSGAAATVCLDDTEATLVSTTYTAMSGYHGGCTTASRIGPDCNAAIHRFCAAQGMSTGFGPLENSGDGLLVACNPAGAVLATSYTALSAHVPSCDGATERIGEACNEAFHQWCRAQGYASGHGPLENSGDVAYAACLGEP